MSNNPTPETKNEMVGTEQPFMSHLIELRDRLMRAMIAVGVVAIGLSIWPGPNTLFDYLSKPLISHLPEGAKMITIGVTDPFFVTVKLLLLTAFLLALPFVLYQVWAFIAPGLYKKEKKLMLPIVISSTLLFFSGMAFSYFIVFGRVFTFILHFAPQSVQVAPDMGKYLSFALNLFVAFGVAFEVPIVVVVLVSLGMVSIEKLKSIRGYIIVAAFVIAAVVTPPDVVSQLALAIPMCILYELGIFVARFVAPKKEGDEKEEATEGREVR